MRFHALIEMTPIFPAFLARALSVSVIRSASFAGVQSALPLRNRWFAVSLLEGAGFELGARAPAAQIESRHSTAKRLEPLPPRTDRTAESRGRRRLAQANGLDRLRREIPPGMAWRAARPRTCSDDQQYWFWRLRVDLGLRPAAGAPLTLDPIGWARPDVAPCRLVRGT
jgi:hypothetical protein